MEKNKLSVGQTVWYKEERRYNNDAPKELIETKINKIGKKWFIIECEPYTRFSIETLKIDSGKYTSYARVYLSDVEYKEEIEVSKIEMRLKGIFQYNSKLSLEKLRAIDKIISE